MYASTPYLARLTVNYFQPGKYTDAVLRSKRNRGVASFLKFLNIVYLAVSRYCLMVFSCSTLADGSRVLSVYPSLSCDSAQYKVYMGLAIAGTIIYTAGFPAVVGAAVFYMHRHRLHTNKDFIEILGWVYCPYEAKAFFYGEQMSIFGCICSFFHWTALCLPGIIQILCRTCFLLLAQLRQPEWQSLCTIVLVFVYVCGHVKQEPYKVWH